MTTPPDKALEAYKDLRDKIAENLSDSLDDGLNWMEYREQAETCLEAIADFGGVVCHREPVAYACSTRPNHLWSAAQFNNADPKNRTDCDIPLHAPLPIAGKGDEWEPKLEKLPVAFEVLDTENGVYLTRSEQAAINTGFEYNGLYRRSAFPAPPSIRSDDREGGNHD